MTPAGGAFNDAFAFMLLRSTRVQVVVGVEIPDGWQVRRWHKVAQEEVEGVLLLCIGVSVAVKAAKGCQLVPNGSSILPVTALALENRAVRFRSTILYPPQCQTLLSIEG